MIYDLLKSFMACHDQRNPTVEDLAFSSVILETTIYSVGIDLNPVAHPKGVWSTLSNRCKGTQLGI